MFDCSFHVVDISTLTNLQFQVNLDRKLRVKNLQDFHSEPIWEDYDISQKVMNCCWHPKQNIVAVSCLNCVFFYNSWFAVASRLLILKIINFKNLGNCVFMHFNSFTLKIINFINIKISGAITIYTPNHMNPHPSNVTFTNSLLFGLLNSRFSLTLTVAGTSSSSPSEKSLLASSSFCLGSIFRILYL